jgi:hypothetical protein
MTTPTIDTFTAVVNDAGTGFDVALTTTGFDVFTLTRIALDTSMVVRGAQGAELAAGAAFVADLEAPQNTSASFHVTCVRTSDSVEATSLIVATGVVDYGWDALYDLSRPDVPLQVHPASVPTTGQDVPGQTVWAQNRPDPVVISQVLRYPSGSLALLTATLTEKKGIEDTLKRGNIIAFSPRYPLEYGFDGLWYLSVSKMTIAPLNPGRIDEPSRQITLDIQRIAPPPATFQPIIGRTWADIIELGWTWEQIIANGWTWLDVMFA